MNYFHLEHATIKIKVTGPSKHNKLRSKPNHLSLINFSFRYLTKPFFLRLKHHFIQQNLYRASLRCKIVHTSTAHIKAWNI